MASPAAIDAATAQGTADTGLVSSAYADAFVRGPPREGVQRVQTRLHKARVLSDELAEYFAARRELESTYLKALQKMAKRSFLSDPAALGPNFTPVYERLVAEIGETARIHGDLERKLESDCELPMRYASQQGEWARIKEHDDNLSGTLREINSLETQLGKDQKKAETASSKKALQAQQKVADTERSLRQTMDLWEAEAPFAFEAYQRIDAARLTLMKETVAKFETAQSDAAQRLMSMTEQTMQVALNFEPQTDMQEFVLKNATAKNATSATRPTVPARDRSGTNVAPTTSSRAGSRQVSDAAGSTLGLGEFGGRAPSRRSTNELPSPVEQSTITKPSGGSTLKNALTRFGRGRSNKGGADTSTQANYGALSDRPTAMRSPSAMAGRNASTDELASVDSGMERRNGRIGAGTAATGGAALAGVAGAGAALGLSSNRGPEANDFMQPMTPTRATNTTAPVAQSTVPESAPNLPQIDSEGFSIPPPDRKPWSPVDNNGASSALANGDDQMQDLAPKTAGMSISQKPVQENSEQDQAALERMRSTLLSAGTPGAVPHRRNTTRRDRRDVRNTTYNPMMDGANRPMSTFGVPATDQNTSTTANSAYMSTPSFGKGRTMSMISNGSAAHAGNTTLESLAAQGPSEPGLHAFINERVNVIMSGREVTKVMVVGEIAVSARDLPSTEPLNLRIDAFEQLEKAAANPQFLKETGAGEYTMDVASIARQGGTTTAGRGTLLKYQLHVPLHKADQYVPFHVVPQWRCEAQQTSILINYSVNPSARLLQDAAQVPDAAIRDIVMAVDVTSPSVSNLMSKPAAIYTPEQKRLVWRLQDAVPLTNADSATPQAAQKALARFQVDTPSEVRPLEVRWKLPGVTASTLGVSLTGETQHVQFDSVTRTVVSGKHVASP